MQTANGRREPAYVERCALCAHLAQRIAQNEAAIEDARAQGLERIPGRIARQTSTLRARLAGERRKAAAMMAAAGAMAESGAA